jgi:hypothetical protein
MSLTVPPYIVKAGVCGAPVGYEWPEGDKDHILLNTNDEKLGKQMGQTSPRGILALSIGMTEWIAWRFQGNPESAVVLNIAEAMWATMADWRYAKISAYPDFQKGPVGGPLYSAVTLLVGEVAKHVLHDEASWPEAACLSNLCRHVLPNPKAFTDWRRETLTRLAKWHPSADKGIGDGIPRAAMDPATPYSAELASKAVADFILTLNPAKNRYLRPADEMKAKGFVGTPYPMEDR